MKAPRLLTHRSLFCVASVAALCALPARAAETAAGTMISNQATVTYRIGLDQPVTITSPDAAFVVDRKINLAVSTMESAAVPVAINSTNNALTFTVVNTGNGIQDFALSARSVILVRQAARFGRVPTRYASEIRVRVESGQEPGYQPDQDTATFIDELAPDTPVKAYVVGDFLGSYLNGEISSYHLLAEARQGGQVGGEVGHILQSYSGENTLMEDTIFVDIRGSDEQDETVRDAKHSDFADFKIATNAPLSVVKTSQVLSDPINGTQNPKILPGAIIEYTITVSNDGGQPADDVVIEDDLAQQIQSDTIGFLADSYGPGRGILFESNSFGGAALSNQPDGDFGEFMVDRVTVHLPGPLMPGGVATMKFRVQIK